MRGSTSHLKKEPNSMPMHTGADFLKYYIKLQKYRCGSCPNVQTQTFVLRGFLNRLDIRGQTKRGSESSKMSQA